MASAASCPSMPGVSAPRLAFRGARGGGSVALLRLFPPGTTHGDAGPLPVSGCSWALSSGVKASHSRCCALPHLHPKGAALFPYFTDQERETQFAEGAHGNTALVAVRILPQMDRFEPSI